MGNKMRLIIRITAGMFLLLQVNGFAQGQLDAQRPASKPASRTSDVGGRKLNVQRLTSNIQPPASNENKAQYQKVPEIKGYTYNIKRLLEKVEENLKKVDKEIKEKEILKRNQEREAKVRKHFKKGNALYKEGKLKQAKKEWLKALEIARNPEMRDYIREAAKRAKQEELARKKEEKKSGLERTQAIKKQVDSYYRKALSYYRHKSCDLTVYI